MRRLTLLLSSIAALGCARSDTTADTSSPAAATQAGMAIRASDIAGNWSVVGKNANDSVLVSYDLSVPNESTYTITFANGQRVNGRIVSIAGDSIVIEAGPYPSVLRKGANVRTVAVVRLQDGKLVGNTTARYDTKTADSVISLRMEGTRKP